MTAYFEAWLSVLPQVSGGIALSALLALVMRKRARRREYREAIARRLAPRVTYCPECGQAWGFEPVAPAPRRIAEYASVLPK